MLNHRSVAGVKFLELVRNTSGSLAAIAAIAELMRIAQLALPMIRFDADDSAASNSFSYVTTQSVAAAATSAAVSPVSSSAASTSSSLYVSASTITETQNRVANSNSSDEVIELLSAAIMDLLKELGASLAKQLNESDSANRRYLLQLKADHEKRLLKLLNQLHDLKARLRGAELEARRLHARDL